MAPDAAKGHVLRGFRIIIAGFVRHHRGAAEVVFVEIPDAVGVDSGDPLAGGHDVIDVFPVNEVRRDSLETVTDLAGGRFREVIRVREVKK